MSYSTLLNNIKDAESRIQKSSSFDISKFILPEKEIVKILIAIDNVNMDKEDIDLMVDGFKSNDFKVSDINLSEVQGEALGVLDGIQNDINDLKESDSEISNKLNDEINSSKEKIKSIKSKSEDYLLDLKEKANTPYKKKLIKDRTQEELKNNKIFPISIDSPYFEKARKLIRDMIEIVSEFIRKVKDLVVEFVLATINMGSCISGGILLLMPLGFNVPGMISLIISVLQIIIGLQDKYKDVLTYFTKFRNLNILIPEPFLSIISVLLSTFYVIITKLFSSIDVISFVKKVIETIKESSKDDKKNARKIVRRLKKLKYLPKYNNIEDTEKWNDVDEDDIEEILSILEIWEIIEIEGSNFEARRKNSGDIDNLVSLLDKLEISDDGISSNDFNLKELLSIDVEDKLVSEMFVYDIELPNGEYILGLTEDEFQFYKNTYNVIYSNNIIYKYGYSNLSPMMK